MSSKPQAETIAWQLGKAKKQGGGFMCRCPAHEDRNPSLYVADGENGGLILKCHAGCTYSAILAAIKARGLIDSAALLPPRSPESDDGRDELSIIVPVPTSAPNLDWTKLGKSPPTSLYAYRDGAGALLHYVGRWDSAGGRKEIRPVLFGGANNGQGEWALRGFPAPRPLYGLEHLAKNPEAPVLVVEGEKAAEAARSLLPDWVVVSWSGGASSVAKAAWDPLRGRAVTLWPDNDEPGKKAMAEIADKLQSSAQSLRLVSLPAELPAHWDLADQLPPGVDIKAVLASAPLAGTGLRRHIVTAAELLAQPMPPQEFLIEPWLPKNGLAMIWAARGLGKTWFALTLAIAVAAGKDFLGYEVSRGEPVLFIDGEMALDELQQRVRSLCPNPPDKLHILPSEALFRAGAPLNIKEPADQQRVLDAISALERERVRPALIILDNLSSLTAGIDENDNSALDGIIRWLLRMRHSGVTVIFVHHANKSGDQRGASRREDQLNTSIKLEAPKSKEGSPSIHDGAHFIMEFTKTRGRKPRPHSIELKLVQHPDGHMVWAMSTGSRASPQDDVLKAIAEHRPSRQEDLVEVTRRQKGTISRDCTALASVGLIERQPLRLTAAGRKRVLELWPELYHVVAQQGDLGIDRTSI